VELRRYNMWRPKDWENPASRTIEDINQSYPNGIPKGYHILQEAGFCEGYETGADAILKALIEKGTRVNSNETLCDLKKTSILPFGAKGYLVFIGEE